MKRQVIRDVMLDNCSQVTLSSCRVCKEKQDDDHMLTMCHECRGVWMGVMLLYVASCIIFPIIFKEGIRAVFMPFLVRKPQVRTETTLTQLLSAYIGNTASLPHVNTVSTWFRHALLLALELSSNLLSAYYWLHIAILCSEMLLLVVT